MIRSIRQAPLRLFLAVAVAVVGLMTVADLPSASPVHAQEQAVTATRDATGESPPARPTDLQALAEPDSVSLAWTASTDQTVTHYAVLRRDRDDDVAGVFKVIDSNAGPGLSYTDGSVSPGGSYVYRVKAVSPTGVSQWSSYARADIPADPEDLAPSGLSAKAVFDGGDSAGVELAWDAPAVDAASVTGYEILRAVGDGDLATLVADTGSPATTYADDTATEAGESYAYRVKALRGEEASQPSDRAVASIPKVTAHPVERGIAEEQNEAEGSAGTVVSADWGLIPSGLVAGDRFRLLFRTSTTRDATSTDIADYDAFVQAAAGAGHADIQSHNAAFKVLGSTADVDARDNTTTTYTADDKGVAVYWLNGDKVADDYEDFYDGSWSNADGGKNEDGGAHTSPQVGTTAGTYTGSTTDGREATITGTSRALGTSNVRVGRPLGSGNNVGSTATGPFYGLSGVFVVGEDIEVPETWSLIPSGLGAGDRFRLIFLSSTTRLGGSTNIADYNGFVQTRAANGHADIRRSSSLFRVVGSTAAVDARDNTSTTYTADDKGVPIYWLGGNKVAGDYEEFYDGEWDDEANAKDESGNNRSTSDIADLPYTGSEHNGTEDSFQGSSRALGAVTVRVGRPNDSGSNNGPLSSSTNAGFSEHHPLYGLSAVFRVTKTTVPADWSLIPSGLVAGDRFRLLFIGTTGRNASSSDIADYNTFVQNLVANNGHADIKAFSGTFRMLGSTEAVDARDNTGTTGTGVPIYWLGGAQVADDYADFYDGDWDEEATGRRENGDSVTIGTSWKIWTGSAHDGTEAMDATSGTSRALGNSNNAWVMQGSPNGSTSGHGPIGSNTANRTTSRGVYGLSGVFVVSAAPITGDFDLHDDNRDPRGVWGNDDTIWVSNSPNGETEGDKIVAYDRSNGSRDRDKDFNTLNAAGNNAPARIWSDGETMFVLDSDDAKVYAYKMSDKSHDDSKDITVAADNESPRGIWGNHETIWVSDTSADKVYAYKRVEDEYGTRDYARDFNTLRATGNTSARGIWSDGLDMFVADTTSGARKVYSYSVFDMAHRPARGFNLDDENGGPAGIWGDDGTLWVVDVDDDKLYAYGLPPTPEVSVAASPRRVAGGGLVTLTGMVTDPDAETLTYAWTSNGGGAFADASALSATWTAPGAADADYTVTLTLTVTGVGGAARTATADVVVSAPITGDFDLHDDNATPRGIWGNDDTIWVSNSPNVSSDGDKIFAYDRSTRVRDEGKDFNTLNAAGNNTPTRIWSDGETMFVLDAFDDRVYAYNMDDKARDDSKDIALAADNGRPEGIWGNGETIWVSDHDAGNSKLFAYKRVEDPDTPDNEYGMRDADRDFNTLNAAGNTNVRGIWSDGTDMFVADARVFDGRVFAYSMSDMSHRPARSFNLDDQNQYRAGVWGDDGTLWVVDGGGGKLYAYDLPSPPTVSVEAFPLHVVSGDSLTLTGTAAEPEGHTLTYAWASNGGGTFADTTALSTTWTAPDATVANQTVTLTLTVTDTEGETGTATVDVLVSPPAPIIDDDFGLHEDNAAPRGIWGNDDTIWVSNTANDKIYAYARSTGLRDEAKDFDTLIDAGNNAPTRIWSDGETMFVLDPFDEKVYAYNMDDKARDDSKDIALAAGNGSPQGIWGNDRTIWVSDDAGNKLFAYKRVNDPGTPDNEYGTRDADSDFNTLMDAGNGFSRGIWSDGMDMFVVDTTSGAQKVFSYSMSDMAYGSARSFDLEEGNDHPAGIWSDGATLWVVDTGDDKLYAYGLPAAEAVSDDATLSALPLSGVTLSPSFAADTLTYTASVGNDVTSTTVTAMANDDGATVAIDPADADDTADGHQVTLGAGDTAISVTVTAEDGTTMQTYAVTVTRAAAEESAETTVPANWSLVPQGLGVGDRFRLIFISSTTRNGSSSDIADYNTFVQTAAANGHADIQSHSSTFRVVGSTADVDARDNTATTYTSADKGVAIYWLGGNKVADDYEGFYDGDWDDEANAKDESGSNRSTSGATNYPLTGSDHDGTEAFTGLNSRALGSTSFIRIGQPNFSASGDGPLSSGLTAPSNSSQPLYGLSGVFVVAVASDDATLSALSLSGITLSPSFAADTLTYTASVDNDVASTTVTATANDDGATVAIVPADADDTADDHQVTLGVGDTAISVTVTAEDGTTMQTYAVTVTRADAVEVKSIEMRRYDGDRNDEPYRIGDELVFVVLFSHLMGCESQGEGRVRFYIGTSRKEASRYITETHKHWHRYIVQEGDLDTDGITIPAGPEALPLKYLKDNCDGSEFDETRIAAQGPLADRKVDGVRPTPEFAATSVDGNSVIIIFSETLSATTAPANAFTLSVDTGTAPTVSTATASGDTVTLGLASAVTSGQAVTVAYIDPTLGNDDAAVQDSVGNDAVSFTTGEGDVPAVSNAVGTGCSVVDGCYLVSADWSLIPSGLGAGDRFRLIFISSTTRDGSSSDIADYNTFVQTAASNGHADIQSHSSAFRVVGSTADVDARDNTATTYTADDKGVAIYWLGGNKVADQYEDFYDGDWDDEANAKDESGSNRSTSGDSNFPFTGSNHDGTESINLVPSGALGTTFVRLGEPNSAVSGRGPLNTNQSASNSNARPLYGLSGVFVVGTAVASNDATLNALSLSDITLSPSFAADTLTYTASVSNDVTSTTVTATANDDGATVAIVPADADDTADDHQVTLGVGDTAISVTVTAEDETTTQTYAVTVTRAEAINTAPEFNGPSGTGVVFENSPPGTAVSTAYSVIDADGDTLTYTLEGTDAASFDIDSASGQIQTKTGVTYNYEATISYSVIVKADDGKGGTDTYALTISIADVDEPPSAPITPTVSAVSGSSDSLLVEWAAPDNSGKPDIESYDLQYRKGTTGDFADGPQDETVVSATIDGLDADSAYQVRVRATNDEGDSGWSSAGSGTTNALAEELAVTITADPTTVNGGGTVMLSTTVTGDVGDVRYDWDGDGFSSRSIPNPVWTAGRAPFSDSNVTLSLTVFDDVTNASALVIITVRGNQAPEVSLGTIATHVDGGEEVSLTASATDPEGDGLTYAWTSSAGGSFDDAGTLDTTWTAPPATRQDQPVTLTLTVTDDGAGTRSTTRTRSLTVRANEAPAGSVSAQPETVLGGKEVELTASVADPENGALTFAWNSSGGGSFANASAANTTWTAPAAATADQTVTLTLTVTDTVGDTDFSTDVTVRDNQPPTVVLGSIPTEIGGGVNVSLVGATATDPEGDTLTYAWTSAGGGSFADAGALDTVWTAPDATDADQAVTLTLTVTDDGAGARSASDTVTVTVRALSQLAVTITADPTTVNGGGTVMLSSTVTGASGNVTYSWSTSGAGTFSSTTIPNPVWTAPPAISSDLRPQLFLLVIDSSRTASTSVRVMVRANQAPEVSATAAPASVAGGGAVTLDGTASDPEGDTLTYAWTSDGGGSFDDASALDTTWTAPDATDAAQTIMLTLMATDDGAGARSASHTVTVTVEAQDNTAPAFTTGADFSTNENQAATFQMTAMDADAGDEVTYAITGGADLALFQINATNGQLAFPTPYDHENPADADGNNVYLVTVTATGGTGARALTTDQAITVTVLDVDEPPSAPAAPTVSAVDGSSDSLSVSWTAPDNTGRPDIDSYDLRYRKGTDAWADGPQNETGTTATIDGLDADSLYQVQVRATNEDGDGFWSQSGSGTTNEPTDPTDADNLTATAHTGKIRLGWMGSADAYEFRRKEDGGAWSEWTAAETRGWFVLRNATTLDDYDVLALTEYTYQVRVAGDAGNLGEDSATLGAPITLRLGATEYRVDEGAGELFFTVLAETPVGLGRYDRDIRPSFTSAGVVGPLPEGPLVKTQEDYELLIESLRIEPGDFVLVNGMYVASRLRSVGIVDDTLVEGDETFELRLLLAGGVSRFFTLGAGDGRAEVTIVDNDQTSAAPAAGNPLTGFELVDATAHLDAGAVDDGATLTGIDPAKLYGFRANVASGAELKSVRLELSGPGPDDRVARTDNDEPYALHGDSGGHEHGAALAAGSYTLTATAHSEKDGGGSELGTLSVEFTVAGEPLTARFEGLPEGTHGGAGETFAFRLVFSEAVTTTPEALRDHALEVTNAAVKAVTRVDDRSDLWEVRLTPESDAMVTVSLLPAADCDAAGAVCTEDGRMLSFGVARVILGPPPNSPATGQPTISGTAQVGSTLTADTSGIADDDGLDNVTFSYQWVADDANIQGATGSSYTLADRDKGKTIKVIVSFTDDANNEESLPSAATDAVAALPGKPQDLEGEATAQEIELTWTAPTGDAVVEYVVYRGILQNGSMNGQALSKYATIDAAGKDMTYTDDNVEEGVEYRYRVAAVNSDGEGKKSTWLDIRAE